MQQGKIMMNSKIIILYFKQWIRIWNDIIHISILSPESSISSTSWMDGIKLLVLSYYDPTIYY